MKSKLLLSFALFFSIQNAKAGCDYFRIGSSLPVRSNKNIFVETWKVSCERNLYFATTVSNTEIVDPVQAIIYFVKSPHYGEALRAHVVADRWAVLKYTRYEVEDLMANMGFFFYDDQGE